MLPDHMLFLTYTPRADSERRGYLPWLRAIDTPFFNSVPGIARYTNWKLINDGSPRKVDWEWLSLLYIEPGKTVDYIWSNEKLKKFANNWNIMWGRDPGNRDLSVNYQVMEAKRVQTSPEVLTDFVTMVLNPDRAKLPKGAEVWQVTHAMLGDTVQGEFAFVNLPVNGPGADPAWGKVVLLLECVAKPDSFYTI